MRNLCPACCLHKPAPESAHCPAEVCGSVALILLLVETQISLIVAQIIETVSESFRNKGWKGGSKYCQVFEYKVLKGKKKKPVSHTSGFRTGWELLPLRTRVSTPFSGARDVRLGVGCAPCWLGHPALPSVVCSLAERKG